MVDLGFAVDDGWAPANPTIAADGDGFRVVVRVLNWRVDAGHHVVDAPDGVFRSRNFVLTTDRDLAGGKHCCLWRGMGGLKFLELGNQ